MKDTKLVWPEAAVVISGGLTVVQWEPLTVKARFMHPIDDVTTIMVNDQPATEYLLAPDRLSVSFVCPGNAPVESLQILGRPRDLDGAHATLAIRGPHAVLGVDKLLQMIIRLTYTSEGEILGQEDLWGRPDLKAVDQDHLGEVIAAAYYRIAQAIMTEQRGRADIPASERLLGIDVLSVLRTADGAAISRVRVRTPMGSAVRMISAGGIL